MIFDEQANMQLWRMVEKTPPDVTKDADNKRFKFTSVDPHFQHEEATRLWGPYGDKWGIRKMRWDWIAIESPIMILDAEFFYPHPETGETVSFEYRIDKKYQPGFDNAKMIQTSFKKKCLSLLGFNADIYRGMYDDDEYVRDMEIRFGDQDAFFEEGSRMIEMSQSPEDLDVHAKRVADLATKGNITQEIANSLMAAIQRKREDFAK